MTDATLLRIVISLLAAVAGYLLVRHGVGPARRWLRTQEKAYDTILRRQLMLDVAPRAVLAGQGALVVLGFLFGATLMGGWLAGLILAAAFYFAPYLVVRHLEQKRNQRLNVQLVDGLTTLASGVRAGLNLVQSMELLVQNHTGPIQQEFAQLLREYQMGMDLNQAMRNAARRVALPLYTLTFTAIETHRQRGGDTSESLDRIAGSIREIQRIEGKLDALTAQGRAQAWMMAVMPLVFLVLLYLMMPAEVSLLFTDTVGRFILLGVIIAIAIAFVWIRKIMEVDV